MTVTPEEELAFAGPGALAQLVRSRQLHPRELVELCLRRIEQLNPRVNAFRTTLPDQALAEADSREGHDGPLAGVPFAVKDEHALAGQATTFGSRSYGPPASADSEIVRRVRAAGAIPVGITNVPELMSSAWTVSEANGVTRNPWDLSRTPGGSSGGSAAAVAGGLVPAATAGDGGGSIRIPSACCGLAGMKPTRGRVSVAPLRRSWFGLTVYGALARTVADSALLLDVIHGALPSDVDHAPPFHGSYREAAGRPPGRLRIAVSAKTPPPLPVRISAEQRTAWQRTATLLSELGHEVVERDPAFGTIQLEFVQLWMRYVLDEAQQLPDRSKLERFNREMAAAGRLLVPQRRLERLLERRERSTAKMLQLWEEVDVLLTPGLATTPIAAEGGHGKHAPMAIDQSSRFSPFFPTYNMTGQPAMVVPAGFGSEGLPLSVQLVGRPGGEDTLYSLAGQVEAARPWAEHRPALA